MLSVTNLKSAVGSFFTFDAEPVLETRVASLIAVCGNGDAGNAPDVFGVGRCVQRSDPDPQVVGVLGVLCRCV